MSVLLKELANLKIDVMVQLNQLKSSEPAKDKITKEPLAIFLS